MENKLTNIKDRVLFIAKKQPMTVENFFKSIGMTSASFRGKAKDSPLNSNAIVNIITKYPEVDLQWLIMGTPSEGSSDALSEVREEPLVYRETCANCKLQLQKIKMLEEKVADLQLDKEDLKVLLGLRASRS